MPATRSSLVLSRHQSTLQLENQPWAKENEIGTRLSIMFNFKKSNQAWYNGTIVKYDNVSKYYHILFDDGEPTKMLVQDLDIDAHAGILKILERAV